ncbi:hypothetical protein GW17_00017890, partial [Ensete ventricosum]
EVSGLVFEDCGGIGGNWGFDGAIHDPHRFLFTIGLHAPYPYFWLADDKVTVLESEKRAWESSEEAEAIREALNPWRKHMMQKQEDTREC